MRSTTIQKQNNLPWTTLMNAQKLEMYPEELEPKEIEVLNTYPEDQRENLARVWRMKKEPWIKNTGELEPNTKKHLSITLYGLGLIVLHAIGLVGFANFLATLLAILLLLFSGTIHLFHNSIEKQWWLSSLPFEYTKMISKKFSLENKVLRWGNAILNGWAAYMAVTYTASSTAWTIVYGIICLSLLFLTYTMTRIIKKMKIIHGDILKGYYNNQEVPKGWG